MDAKEFVENSSFDEIESQTYAKGSVEGGIDSISKRLGLTEEEINEFKRASIEGPADAPIFKAIGEKIPK